MSFRRFRELFRLDFFLFLRRPLFWIWLFVVFLLGMAMATGGLTISTGDADVGGTKAHVTSEFSIALVLAAVIPTCYLFFIAVAAGMSIIRTDEQRVSELIHSTPVRPGEWIWAKFSACLAVFLLVLAFHLAMVILFQHGISEAKEQDFIGPFSLRNYLLPALVFAVPMILFTAGATFAIGERTRKPILVYLLPVAFFLVTVFFFWMWRTQGLDARVDRLLMLCDPSGFRWLQQTWLRTDRGVDFYNTSPILFDLPFLLSRLAWSALGIAAVASSHLHFARRLRGTTSQKLRDFAASDPVPAATPLGDPTGTRTAPLSLLGMTSRPPGFLRSFWNVARVELHELFCSPGLYLFLPLIVLDALSEGLASRGPFGTTNLATSGLLAMGTLVELGSVLALLLMFYTVESLRRERATGIGAIFYATPTRSSAIWFGKVAANSIVGVVGLVATLITCWAIMAWQGKVPFEILPFAVVWGCLLLPTFVLWCTFVAAVYSLLRSAYATYAIAIGAMIYAGYQLLIGEMTWRGNWPLWNSMRWSDVEVFPLDREALILNRSMVLTAALLLLIIAVRVFPRREFDPQRILLRLRPRALLRTALLLSPVAIVPIGLNLYLEHRIEAGWQSEALEEKGKNYWRKNVATWTDAPIPDLAGVDVKLELEPERHWLRTEGTYRLVNRNDDPLPHFPITVGPHWGEVTWTMNGEAYETEDRAGLHVFTPEAPLAPGEEIVIGFTFEAHVTDGISRNGGDAAQFVVPAGVVLTSFGPSFVPTVGFIDGMGVDEENRYEERVWPEGHWEGDTPAAFGAWTPYPVRLEVTIPEAYQVHGIGTLQSEEVVLGRRTAVWETDYPVNFFNVIAGKWEVRRGEGTAVYYFPQHPYNIDEMLEGLDGARRWYSEWFHPYPWQELKLSEFPALASYAQGFATNITFSEGIGFLTDSDEESNAAFMVAAHEAAHQWWGNLVTPGRGPGGNVLSEGMAHFSTMLLFDQVKGERARMAFARDIEESYGDSRQVDSERPIVWLDGSRPGDTTAFYDKGGWVFWMLLHHMGRDACLEGIRSFAAEYATSRDHPLMQDFLAHLRDFAPDRAAYDAFVAQWFLEVAIPEYHVVEAERVEVETGVWETRATIENVGGTRMPVEIAAVSGKRFPDEDEAREEGVAPPEPYRETRGALLLGPGEKLEITLRGDFEPERVIVDPDVLVLQLERAHAVHRF